MSTRRDPEIDWNEPRAEPDKRSSRFTAGPDWNDMQALARREGGVLTASDLRTCGFSRDAITTALANGHLRRWGKSVYIVGPVTDDLTEARAALKAVPGVLGFQVAGQVHHISAIADPPVSVIVSPDRNATRKDVRVHRIELTRQDVIKRDELWVTTPDVTLVHLARVLPALPYERAVQEAFAKRLTNARQLERALERHRGTARLRRMLELGIDDLRSKAERSLRQWLRAAQLPTPSFNAEVGPWRASRLALEATATPLTPHLRPPRPWCRKAVSAPVTQAIDEPALVIAQIARAL